MITVRIREREIKALIDTGSDLTLISYEVYEGLNEPWLRNNTIKFEGLGSTNNQTIEDITIKLMINDQEFEVVCHVMPKGMLKYPMLLGADFLEQTELQVSKGIVKIKKITDAEMLPDVFSIDIEPEVKKELELSHIHTPEYREQIQKIIDEYVPEPTKDVGISTKIILKDEIPVVARPRSLAPKERETVDKIMQEWLDGGIIQPSVSKYASPIVLVQKKNGTTRVCVDYRELNKKMEKPRFPLPIIEDQINALQGAKVFTTIDLKNGYFHVPVDKESQRYTSFVTPNNQYEFLKTPFGLAIAPAIFQKFIYAVFRQLINQKIVVVYMDDIIILAANTEEAMSRFQRTVEVARQHGLVINWEKCKFLQTEVEYLDHVISNDCVRPSEAKHKAVQGFPMPNTVKELQSFLGLTGYLRKYIPGYSIIARPLTNLLKKDTNFYMGEKEKEAIALLKQALSNKPVLRLYRQGAETELHTDASCCGYGMILLQKGDDGQFHPIYYASGKTTPAEEKYSSYELEVLAIVKALKKFRVYLLGIPFKIITDCQAFTLTMSKRDLCARIARWAFILQEFQYEVQHRPGKNMPHVDALSRHPLPTILLVRECSDSFLSRLRQVQEADEELQPLLKLVKTQEVEGYTFQNNLLYKDVTGDQHLVVPKKLQTQVIQQAHQRGHFGITKTEALVAEDYWFKGLRSKVEKVVRNCLDCILAERKQGKQEGLLQPIGKGDTPLDTFHVDHLGPMTQTKKKYQHLLVIIDAFTKFSWIYPTKSTDSASVINILTKQSAIFGNPRRIVTDRGTAFTSTAFQEYCQNENIQHLLITAGTPRGNGQVERINRTIISILTKLAAPQPENWYRYVDQAQRYLNNSVCRSTAKTPFKLMIGTNMRTKDDPRIKELIEQEWANYFEDERDELRKEAKLSIAKVQEANRRNYNGKRKPGVQYKENDLVAIRRTQFGPGLKLRAKYLGPYQVTKVLRHDRYAVRKIGEHEGPNETSTSADSMKPWVTNLDDISSSEEETNE